MRRTCRADRSCPSPRTRSPCFLSFSNRPGSDKFLRTDFGSFFELRQIADIDRRELLLEGALVKPRFGMRRCSGICPPSNRASAASRTGPHTLVSAAGSLSMPASGPRPILFVLCVDPGFGLSVLMPAHMFLPAPQSATDAEPLATIPRIAGYLQLPAYAFSFLNPSPFTISFCFTLKPIALR